MPAYFKALNITFFALFALSLSSIAAYAQRSDAIAAIVNDDIITYGDVDDRIEVIIKSSKLPQTPEFKRRIVGQVLNALIQEQIQFQEAEKQEIEVTEEQIKNGFTQVAAQNKLPVDDFMKHLRKQNMPIRSMRRQIEAQMLWGEVIQSTIRPQVKVSDQDIEAAIDRMRKTAGKTEYNLSEIFIPVRTPAEERKMRTLIERLHAQLKKGASFPSVARQFSGAAGASQGGLVGWVTEDVLLPSLARAVRDLEPNKLSSIIKSRDGFHILLMSGKRVLNFADPDNITLSIKELALTVQESSEEHTDTKARELIETLTGCLDIDRKAKQWEESKISHYNTRLGDLDKQLKTEYQSLNIGEVGPIESEENADASVVKVKMVCGKTMPEGKLPDPEALVRKIGTKRIDILQKSFLRDLTSLAYIEKRIR